MGGEGAPSLVTQRIYREGKEKEFTCLEDLLRPSGLFRGATHNYQRWCGSEQLLQFRHLMEQIYILLVMFNVCA